MTLLMSYEACQKLFQQEQKIQTIYWRCAECNNEWHQENFYHELPCEVCNSKKVFSGKMRFMNLISFQNNYFKKIKMKITFALLT